jgi:hypothetical protein
MRSATMRTTKRPRAIRYSISASAPLWSAVPAASAGGGRHNKSPPDHDEGGEAEDDAPDARSYFVRKGEAVETQGEARHRR